MLRVQTYTVVDIDLTTRRSCVFINKQPVAIVDATAKSIYSSIIV